MTEDTRPKTEDWRSASRLPIRCQESLPSSPLQSSVFSLRSFDMTSYRLTAIIIGDCHRVEFREALGGLRASTELTTFTTMEEAEHRLSVARRLETRPLLPDLPVLPDLIVIAQSRTGQFNVQQVDRLRRLAPLSRVLGLLGSWCEGETHTGKPWPAASRRYWYNWTSGFHHELNRILNGKCPAWGLPDTTTLDQHLLWSVDDSQVERQGWIVIAATRHETAEVLSDACRGRGFGTVRLDVRRDVSSRPATTRFHVERATAAIWEGIQCDPSEATQLARFTQALGNVPTVALLDFPRSDGQDRARAAGATSVLGKPFLLNDLFMSLDEAIGNWPEYRNPAASLQRFGGLSRSVGL